MQISDEGLRLIKSFEGYLARQKDGSCAAYLCPANVATIGWGCTEGVKLGMVWTLAEAEAGLKREIAKFETAVMKSVTVEMNQNEFDAMVSLAYNIGASAFNRSTVLKRLNKGDRAGAAQAFEFWNKGGGRVLNGLVSRRKREAALFLKPVEAPSEPAMPQAVQETKPTSTATVATVSATVAAAVPTVVAPALPVPAVPEVVTQSVQNVEAWKVIGGQAWTLWSFVQAQPWLSGGFAISIGMFYLWSKRKAAQ
jgi:lysozyme